MSHAHTQAHPSAARPRGGAPRHWRLIALLTILATFAYAASLVPPTARIRIRHEAASFFTRAPVLLLGDSISHANGPARLCEQEVFNAAVPGAKLKDLLGQGVRLANRIHPRRVVVAVGVNDAIIPHIGIGEWTAQYRQLLTGLDGADITLVEINPVDARFPVVARSFDRSFIALQNAAIRDLAARSGARLVRAPSAVETGDGLHPDAAGGRLWRERLAQTACAR